MKSMTERRRARACAIVGAAWLVLCSAFAAPGVAQPHDDEARVLAELQAAHPGTRFVRVKRTPVSGLYEVQMSGTVAYAVAGSTRHLLFGRLFDLLTLSDLTAPKLAARDEAHEDNREGETPDADEPAPDATAIVSPHDLPLVDAIRTVRGNGLRQLVVFSDPGCPYCRRLEEELAGIDDLTVHTFLVPFQGETTPIAIWCTPNHAQAWQQWMSTGERSALAPVPECTHPIGRNLILARRLHIRGTPTLIWADGQRTEGLMSREAIEARLTEVSEGGRP